MKDYSKSKVPVLFELLENRGISQKQLAEAVHVSTGNISDWKSGKSAPSGEVAAKIAAYLNVSYNKIFGQETLDGKIQPTEEEIKFALFNGADGITDEMYQEVKNFAEYVKNREQQKGKK